MSIRLLRQSTPNRTIYSASRSFRPRRFYVQKVTTAPIDYDSGNHEQDDSAARPRKPQAKKAKPRGLNGSSRPKQSKATTSGEDSAPRKDPLAITGLELYLKAIRESGPNPTLLDIERCRPESHTENVESPQYADEYNALVDKLCRSFSRQQLRDFTIMFKINLRATITKHQFAEAIIEKQWKWPSLQEVEKRHRDRTEISVKSACMETVWNNIMIKFHY